MMIEVWANKGATTIAFVGYYKKDAECACSGQHEPSHDSTLYTRYLVDATDTSKFPSSVSLEDFVANYDQFSISSAGVITRNSGDYKNRRIDTLNNSVGLAIGHANGANIFTRL